MKTILKLFGIGIIIFISHNISAQDTLIKMDNERILAKIIEVSSTSVKFYRTDISQGPLFSLEKTDVKSIHYRNGFIENFNSTISSTSFTNTELLDDIDYSEHYILVLTDGTRLKGKILNETKDSILFLDTNIGSKNISRKVIAKTQLEFGDDLKVVTLIDGGVITGKIINRTDNYLVFETKALGKVVYPMSKISHIRDLNQASISKEGKIWFKNPNNTRYLFAPSAFQLKKGEGYYQNIYGLGNAVNYGITNYATVGGGLAGPFGVYLNTKLGIQVIKNVNVAAGVLAGNSFFELNGHNLGLLLGFGLITFGNYDHNITIGAGYGIIDNERGTNSFEKPIYNFNAMTRIGKKFALVTENWMVNANHDVFNSGNESAQGSHYELYYSYAFRYMGQQSTLDAGFVNNPNIVSKGWYIGIPYIGFAIRFGNYKD
jgi:hypothetical protein